MRGCRGSINLQENICSFLVPICFIRMTSRFSRWHDLGTTWYHHFRQIPRPMHLTFVAHAHTLEGLSYQSSTNVLPIAGSCTMISGLFKFGPSFCRTKYAFSSFHGTEQHCNTPLQPSPNQHFTSFHGAPDVTRLGAE